MSKKLLQYKRRFTASKYGEGPVRNINFIKPDHEREYHLLYTALVTKDQGYSPADIRKLNKVLDKLEVIGKAVDRDNPKNPITLYELNASGVVVLEDAEWDFIKDVANGTRWIGLNSRKVASLLDLIESAEPEAK